MCLKMAEQAAVQDNAPHTDPKESYRCGLYVSEVQIRDDDVRVAKARESWRA